MQKTVFRFGLFALIFAAALFLAGLVFGKNLDFSTQEIIGYLTILASLSFVFFGIKHFRDKQNNGLVSFGRAFLIGVLISAFAALGFAIIDYLYTAVINPDFIDEYVAATGDDSAAGFSSGLLALVMFGTVLIIGIIVSLISALILQRK
ncbi:DUF4199 domain-containing protein [Spongiivirga sp. MCCC 1A20706]|uniref:DUF4199 domain-containing protein n=1 Tax=Spongiivirga sp. MCCC 1A20706 TaxID=3160963 RepID=UPI003977420F